MLSLMRNVRACDPRVRTRVVFPAPDAFGPGRASNTGDLELTAQSPLGGTSSKLKNAIALAIKRFTRMGTAEDPRVREHVVPHALNVFDRGSASNAVDLESNAHLLDRSAHFLSQGGSNSLNDSFPFFRSSTSPDRRNQLENQTSDARRWRHLHVPCYPVKPGHLRLQRDEHHSQDPT